MHLLLQQLLLFLEDRGTGGKAASGGDVSGSS
jgi:hypothetical protein